MIAAFCPRCGGWTMWHGDPESPRYREWADAARRLGELVMEIGPEGKSLGPECPQAEVRISQRTCGE